MEPNTSTAAYKSVQPKISEWQQNILDHLKYSRGYTADEIADYFGESKLFIRPRVSELHKSERIVKTGERRKNASGQSAVVWCLAA